MTWIQPFEIAFALAVILLVAEMFVGAFVFLSFSAALFTISILEFFFLGFNLYRDVAVFVLVTIAVFWGIRLVFKTKGDTKKSDGDINEY